MNITVFFVAIVILQLICLLVGKQSSKDLNSQNDYFLAGKTLKVFPLFMTFVATQIGGCLILGASEEAFLFGWPVILYPIGSCLGLLLLASGIGRKMAAFNVSTVAQVFESAYKSLSLKYFASLLSMVSLFLIFITQVVASKKFMLSIGVESNTLFLFFWGAVILYTVLGGLKAVIATDVVQAGFFLAVFAASFFYVLAGVDAPFDQILSAKTSEAGLDLGKFASWLFMPLLFMLIGQDMGQRCFAADSPKTIAKAAGFSSICILLVSIIPVYTGTLGAFYNIKASAGASIFMTVLAHFANPACVALVGAALLAAILSTADSLLNAVTSNLLQDFRTLRFQLPTSVGFSKAVTAFIAICGILISYAFDNVLHLMLLSYELSVCCLFIPLFGALFQKQANKRSAILSVAFGFSGFAFFYFIPAPIPREILSVGMSFGGYLAGEISSRVEAKKGEKYFFKAGVKSSHL